MLDHGLVSPDATRSLLFEHDWFSEVCMPEPEVQNRTKEEVSSCNVEKPGIPLGDAGYNGNVPAKPGLG